jgi:bifunctional NMN adenylyltransferase/nudix hydrolase
MSNAIIYPTSFQAVDIVVFNRATNEILLGSKYDKPHKTPKKEKRFIGGFVDPADASLEVAARRELGEEAGRNLEVSDPKYLGSFRVDDPRYRDSIHKIMSAVFFCEFVYGFATAGDDIAEVSWVNLDTFRVSYNKAGYLAPEHIPLVEMLIQKGVV